MADEEDNVNENEQEEEEVEEKEEVVNHASILKKYHEMRKLNKKSFKKAKEYLEAAGAVNAYRDLMDRYQLLYKKIQKADLDELAAICKKANDVAKDAVKDCFVVLPGKKKPEILQLESSIKVLDDFQNFKEEKDSFGELLYALPKEMGLADKIKIEIGPLKDLMRSVQKISEDYEAEPRRLLDFIRASAICPDIPAIIAFLKKFQANPNFQIVRLKNGFTDSASSGGYRDIKMNILFKKKIICELQLHHQSFYKLKNEGGGHKVYEVTRNFKIQGVVDAKDLFTDKSDRLMDCLDMLLSLTYFSEVARKGPQHVASLKALMDWLEYGSPGAKYAKQLSEQVKALKAGSEEEIAYKAKCEAYSNFFLAQYPEAEDEQKEKAESLALMEKSVKGVEAVFGANHPTTVLFRKLFIADCIYYEEFDLAVKVSKQSVAEHESVFGDTALETLKAKTLLMEALSHGGNDNLKECIDIGVKILPELEKLAKMQGEDEDVEEDEEVDEAALLARVPPSQPVAECCKFIASACFKTNNYDDLIKYGQQSLNHYVMLANDDYDLEDYQEKAEEKAEGGGDEDEYDEDTADFPEDGDIQTLCEWLYKAYLAKKDNGKALFFLNQKLAQLRQGDQEDSDEYKNLVKERDALKA